MCFETALAIRTCINGPLIKATNGTTDPAVVQVKYLFARAAESTYHIKWCRIRNPRTNCLENPDKTRLVDEGNFTSVQLMTMASRFGTSDLIYVLFDT